MKIKRMIPLLLLTILLSLNLPTLSLAYGGEFDQIDGVQQNVPVTVAVTPLFNLIEELDDEPILFFKIPPAISADDVNVGSDINILIDSAVYADAINSVTVNGNTIAKGSGGYSIDTVMTYDFLVIDKSNFTQPGSYKIVIKANNYLDAECTAVVNAVALKTPPTLSTLIISVGDKAVISSGDATYANSVTKIIAPAFTIYEAADGDIISIGGDIIITKPAEISGTFPLKLVAPGYSDASISVTVNKLASPKITAKDIYIGEYPVIDTDDATYASAIKKVIIDGTTYSAADFTVKGDLITLKKPLTKAGTINVSLTSYAYADAVCTLKVLKSIQVATQPAITEPIDDFTIGDADKWALPEINKAATLDLLPDILSSKDLTKPMTREEFCELSVRLYEKMTGNKINPADSDTFSDTTNTQILKAYSLGITSGTSASTFDPKTQINREQCAAMLFRTIKLIKPNADYDVSSAKPFPDRNNISAWADDATKYMNKNLIIVGDSNGNFMPKPSTNAQLETGYGMAKREETILMVTRTYEKLAQ